MQPTLSRVFVLVALGACASETATIHHGTTGSGSDDDPGMDAGVPVGSGSSAQPPPPGTLYGTVLDERGDQINFSTGEPVHTHVGPAIDLGAGGCPIVYKYAYLEDQNDPTFGRQTSINPLEWNVTSQVGSLDDAATAYRVRLDDGTVALDWTPTLPDGNGLYTVRLYRNGNPSLTLLGDHTGKMWIDVRFKDLQGNETVDSACWQNHPMAAPLEVDAATTSDLFGWTLPAHSPISTAINDASLDGSATEPLGASVFTQNIVQHTAEPVTLHLDHSAISGTASDTVVPENVVSLVRTEDAPCTGVDAYECDPFPAAPSTTSSSGALSAVFDVRVVDAVSGTIVCHNPDAPGSWVEAIDGCVVPARGANEAPHPYTVIYAINSATSIAPEPGLTAREATVSTGAHFQATMTSNSATGCAEVSDNSCLKEAIGFTAFLLDTAHIDFDPFTLIVNTAPDSTASLESIGAYATPSLSIVAQSWDAGDAGFDD